MLNVTAMQHSGNRNSSQQKGTSQNVTSIFSRLKNFFFSTSKDPIPQKTPDMEFGTSEKEPQPKIQWYLWGVKVTPEEISEMGANPELIEQWCERNRIYPKIIDHPHKTAQEKKEDRHRQLKNFLIEKLIIRSADNCK